MASSTVPVTIAQRHKLLYNSPPPPAELVRWGDRYRDKGLLHDALEFYAAAKEERAILALCAQALETADLVLYLNARRARSLDPDHEELRRLRACAVGQGKESVARRVDLLLLK